MKLKNISKAVLVGALLISPLTLGSENGRTAQAASTIKKQDVKYTNATVQLKESRSSKSKTLTTIPKGKTVQYLKAYGSWSQVKYGSKTGYVATKTLSNTNNTSAVSLKKGVLENTTELKEKRDSKSKRLITIPKGETVEIVKNYGSWTQVKYQNVTGYIATKQLIPVEAGSSKQEQFIDKIKENKLISYRYDLTSDNYYITYIPKHYNSSVIMLTLDKNDVQSIYVSPQDRFGPEEKSEHTKRKSSYDGVIRTLSDAICGKNTNDANMLYNLLVSESDYIVENVHGKYKVSNGSVKIAGKTFRTIKNNSEYMMFAD